MTDHRHVVHVAFDDHFLDVDTLDVDNYDITLLVDSYAAGRISKSLLDRFARVGVLNLPDGLGVEGYDQVVDQMIDLVKDFSEDFGPPLPWWACSSTRHCPPHACGSTSRSPASMSGPRFASATKSS